MSALAFSAALTERLARGEYRVTITGASGWLGQACLEMLSSAFGSDFADRVHCFGSAPRTLRLRSGQTVGQLSLSAMRSLVRQPTMLLHFAYLTKEKVAAMSLDDYVATNRAISRSTVEAAQQIGVDRVFLVSSGAVYQAMVASAGDRSVHTYGALKLEDEALFERFAQVQDGRRVVTARLFNLSGPYINKLGSYALASFIEQARRRPGGGCININAAHPVIRSYVGVENLLGVALSHLMGDAGDPYLRFDTAGEREVEVQDLAEVVRSLVNPDADIRRPDLSPTRADRYVGDGAIFHSLASRHGIALHDLRRQVRDTADYLEEVSRQ